MRWNFSSVVSRPTLGSKKRRGPDRALIPNAGLTRDAVTARVAQRAKSVARCAQRPPLHAATLSSRVVTVSAYLRGAAELQAQAAFGAAHTLARGAAQADLPTI